MPPKGAASSKKNAKPVFDPFERVCTYTTIPLRDPAASGGGDVSRAAAPQPPPQAQPQQPGDEAGNSGKVGEFTASELLITPPLPRTEVSLLLRFRLTVSLCEGDTIYVHLPKFNGPPAQQFGLLSTAQTTTMGGNDEAINTATCFRAFWSGTSAKVVSAVHQIEFKRGKKGGAPPKQVVMLQCIRDVPANALMAFAIPRALGIVTPDKLPANSSKLKLEGPLIYNAESRRILKQVILSSSEVKKQTVVEELATYEHSIAAVMRDGGLKTEDRQLCEQLSLEELDQIWQAAQYRRRYPVPMTWTVAQDVSVAYEAAGSFVKRLVQNAITCIKDFDPLAVHKEVARNWGVKVAAVVMLDDFLSAQWTGLYPGVPRSSLFAACLLTMEPEDVGRVFLAAAELPPRSIAEELMSAFRMRAGLDTPTPANANATSKPGSAKPVDEKREAELLTAELLHQAGAQSRCGSVLNKWTALLTALLPASLVVDSGAERGSPTSPPRLDRPASSAQEEGGGFAAAAARAGRSGRRKSSSAATANSAGGAAVATLLPPPTLYVGYRDVPAEAQRTLRALKRGDWFVMPFQVLARQSLPYAAVTPSSQAAAGAVSSFSAGENGVSGGGGGGGGSEEHDGAEDDGAAEAIIPDNAVVVELRNVVEGLELADASLSPHNRAWLLPLATSCRVVTVEEDQHEVLHVVVEMEGSLVGQINDAYLPQSDRGVATVILSKYLAKAEQTEAYVASFSNLTALYARRNERRRLHPPTLIRAQYLAHYNAAMRASAAKYNVEEAERVEWQVRTHDAQLLDEGVVKPAVWEPIQKKYMTTVEQFFLGHSRSVQKLEEGTLAVDLENYTIDYGGKGPRALRRVVEKVYVTHEAVPRETTALLEEHEEQYAKQLAALDSKLGITSSTVGGAGESGKRGSTKRASAAGSKKKKG